MSEHKLDVKWTLFTQNHWEFYEMVWRLVPEHYSRDMRLLKWNDNLERLRPPATIQNIFLFSEREYGKQNKLLRESRPIPDMPEFWDLIFCFCHYHKSICSLLSKELRELVEQKTSNEKLRDEVKSIAKRHLRDNPSSKRTREHSMLVISILQLTASSHSLSFLLCYKYLMENYLSSAFLRAKTSKRLSTDLLLSENIDTELLFKLSADQVMPFEDSLQSVRLLDLCHLVLSSPQLSTGIIAIPDSSPPI